MSNNDSNILQMSYPELAGRICDIYSSDEYHKLALKLSSETYLDSISKSNSEAVYSSFLSWILDNGYFQSLPVSPLHNLLRLLARNAAVESGNSNQELMSRELRHAIITNDISISHVSVQKEVPAKNRCSKKDGRIDIVINFTWSDSKLRNPKNCRILIENKVYSNEHDEQCRTYYSFFNSEKDAEENHIDENIFCFLSIDKLDKISDSHYIRINYQELLEWVLIPLKAYKTHFPPKYSIYLEDFIETITSIRTNGRQQIAMDNETAELLRTFYEKNSDLIRAAILQSDDEEVKNAVEASQRKTKTFTVEFPGKGTVGITSLVQLVYEIIKYLAKTTPSGDLIKDFEKIGSNYGSRPLLSDKEEDYIDGKGTKRHVSAVKSRDDIRCADGKIIYCSNQLACDEKKDNVFPFIDHINNGNYGITIKQM